VILERQKTNEVTLPMSHIPAVKHFPGYETRSRTYWMPKAEVMKHRVYEIRWRSQNRALMYIMWYGERVLEVCRGLHELNIHIMKTHVSQKTT
jgi:hypothetical protein